MRFGSAPLLVLCFGCSGLNGTAVGQSDTTSATDAALDGQVRLRIVSGNISAGNLQSYDTGEGMRILQGVKADVALVQEMNIGADAAGAMRSFVDSTFGQTFYFFREDGAQLPNAVISRYPIIDHGQWHDPAIDNRTLVWARIDIPGDRDLWAISVHLSTKNAPNRQAGAQAIVDGLVSANVPARDYVVLGGDFNTHTRSEPAITTLGQAFVTTGPYPVDGSGNDRTNAARAMPYDWVLADSDLDTLKTPVVIGQSTYSNGLVVDTRIYQPLSDLAPAEEGDSAATNMQHMAIVRDFLLPPGVTTFP